MKNRIISSLLLLGVTVFGCKHKDAEPKPNENNHSFNCVPHYFLEIKSPANIEDTYVSGYNGGNSISFGADNKLEAGSWRAADDVSGTYYDNSVYVKFDYHIPSETVIDAAFITLSVDTFGYNSIPQNSYGHSIDDITKSIRISNITSSWSESSLNYFNQPTENNVNALMYPITANQFQEYTFNVTELIKDQLSKGNNGFKIALTNPSGYNLLRFASSENAYPTFCPKLTIGYHSANY